MCCIQYINTIYNNIIYMRYTTYIKDEFANHILMSGGLKFKTNISVSVCHSNCKYRGYFHS